MITLVTGYNNTGKSDWIYDQIRPKIVSYLRESDSEFRDDSEGDWRIVSDIFKGLTASTQEGCYYTYYNQPENGLHPSVQSEIIAEANHFHNQGYDVYIETHSDHIINAIRIAIKQGFVKPEDVKILFFKAIDDIVEIQLDSNGQFDKRPVGFCDEYSKQLDKLID